MAREIIKKFPKTALKNLTRGFTVMELVIVLIVSSVLVISVTPFFRTNIQAYMTARTGKEMLEQSRIGFNRMMSEIRRIPKNCLLELSSHVLRFWVQDQNGNIPALDVKYSYNSSYGQILRNDIRLVEGVSDFTVTGYTKTGATTTDETQVWRIRISMTLGLDDQACTVVEEVVPLGFIISQF
jgi:Tfp pilus assembly protein FimT